MFRRSSFLVLLGVLGWFSPGCLGPGSSPDEPGGGTTTEQGGGGGSGGDGGAGGAQSSGGSAGTGGSGTGGGAGGPGGTAATGGSRTTGGSAAGGTAATGGTMRAGGTVGTGGALTGGTMSTGGRPGTGGTAAIPTGGTAMGGSTGTGGRTTATGGRTTGTGGRTTGAGGSTAAAGGATTATGGTQAGGTTGGTAATGGSTGLANFSFFVTSIEAMRELSGSQDGFGGDLRFGEATGLAGADKICRTIAERSMAGAGAKGWAAFLSATTGGANGGAVNAIDRVGNGPWYDRLGRVVALKKEDLASTRPASCNTAICSDLPNENGVPNHQGVDNHDVLTGSNASGKLNSTSAGATCNDWTSSVGSTGKPMCGHSWPANSGQGWIQAHGAGGCKAGVNLAQTGGAGGTDTVGGGGGYGGIYCFALQP